LNTIDMNEQNQLYTTNYNTVRQETNRRTTPKAIGIASKLTNSTKKPKKCKHQMTKIPSQYRQLAVDFYRKRTQHPMHAIVALFCALITIAFSSTSASTFDTVTTAGSDTNHILTAIQMTTHTMARKGKASKTAAKKENNF